MKVQSIQTNPNSNFGNNTKTKQVSFSATPQQMLDAIETARICPGKKMFLANIAEFFTEAERQLSKLVEAPEKFVFKLGKQNEIPKSMDKIGLEASATNGDIYFVSLKDIDNELNEGSFRCSPTSTCSCGVGFSKGEFMSKLLEMLGVENPNEILIVKK